LSPAFKRPTAIALRMLSRTLWRSGAAVLFTRKSYLGGSAGFVDSSFIALSAPPESNGLPSFCGIRMGVYSDITLIFARPWSSSQLSSYDHTKYACPKQSAPLD